MTFYHYKLSIVNCTRTLVLYQMCFGSILTSLCETGGSAKNSTECNKYNDEDFLCCYLTPITNSDLISESENSICYKLEISKYNGEGSINYAQATYQVYCGLGTANVANQPFGTNNLTCHQNNPTSSLDCSKNSTMGNSCCFYEYDGMSGCYWLGAKYYGSTQYNDMVLICGQFYINMNYLFILLKIVFLIII